MRIMFLAFAYIAIAAFLYARGAWRLGAKADEEEMMNASFMPPAHRMLMEFITLMLAIGWPITLPPPE